MVIDKKKIRKEDQIFGRSMDGEDLKKLAREVAWNYGCFLESMHMYSAIGI